MCELTYVELNVYQRFGGAAGFAETIDGPVAGAAPTVME